VAALLRLVLRAPLDSYGHAERVVEIEDPGPKPDKLWRATLADRIRDEHARLEELAHLMRTALRNVERREGEAVAERMRATEERQRELP